MLVCVNGLNIYKKETWIMILDERKNIQNSLKLGWKEILLGNLGETEEVNTNLGVTWDSWEEWFLVYEIHCRIKMKINGLPGTDEQEGI